VPAIGGTAFCKVNGTQLPLRGNFVVSPSAVDRSMVAGQDYVHGYLETPRVPFIEGDISTHPDVSLEDLERQVGVTVTAELRNGKTYVLKEAISKSAFEVQTATGQVRVRWEGTSCEEIG
jgi:hypothetical protein